MSSEMDDQMSSEERLLSLIEDIEDDLAEHGVPTRVRFDPAKQQLYIIRAARPWYIEWVILLFNFGKRERKIGISIDPEQRRRDLQCGHPWPLIIEHEYGPYEDIDAKVAEVAIHTRLKGYETGGGTEWYMIRYRRALKLVSDHYIRPPPWYVRFVNVLLPKWMQKTYY